MTVQQPVIVHHRLPEWLELVGAAMIGAALLFGILLVAGHSDLLPWSSTTPSSPIAALSHRVTDAPEMTITNAGISWPGKAADETGTVRILIVR